MRHNITAALVLAVVFVSSCEDEVGMTSLPRGPDLCVDLLYLPVKCDDTMMFTLVWEVSNVGSVDSPAADVRVDVYDIDWNWHKGHSLGDAPPLRPGEVLYDYTDMRIRDVDPVVGVFYVVVTIDDLDLVVELDEYNNHSAGVVEVI